jgi:energy-converting hydrogenase Eha subunit C
MPHGIYVDDSIYLDVANIHHFKQAITTSIKAIFVLLGELNTVLHQDPISWDKLHKLLIAPDNMIMGLILDLSLQPSTSPGQPGAPTAAP